MKKFPWYAWVALVGLLALLVNLYAYGGLREQPRVGAAVAAQARQETPLMHTYMVGGRYVLQVTPFMRGVARDLASAVWSNAYDSIQQNPGLAISLLDSRAHGVAHAAVRPLYWLAPLLLLVALVGWLMRPKRISLIRNDAGVR